MPGILKGLRGEEWEQALVITRPGGRRFGDRGEPRVIDEPSNIQLILAHNTIDLRNLDKIRDFLKAEYNLSASKRNVKEVLKIFRDEENERIINRIIAFDRDCPYRDELTANELLDYDLSWVRTGSKYWVVAEALERIGYRRQYKERGVVWIRKSPAGNGQG